MSAQSESPRGPTLRRIAPPASSPTRGGNPTLDTLARCLERLEACHAELCQTAEVKREAIVKGDLPGLEGILARERQLTAEIEKEEARRQMAMRVARKGLGLPESDSSRLGDLLDAACDADRERLSGLRNRLRTVLKTLRLKDRINTELLRASLEHVEAFLRSVRDAAGAATLYNTGGKYQSGGLSIIDRNA